mgnify:CR=1 FL=1
MFRRALLARRLSLRPVGVDTHDLDDFRGIVVRTGLVRLVIAASALALVLAAAAAARSPVASEQALIPRDRVGVVVLDLSLSITDGDYAKIRRTLRRIVAEEASIGLVVFSDVPYELLPPGTPAAELQPFLRLLDTPRLGPVRNPWTQTFRAGTRISVALELARWALERDAVASGAILLVSDLETAPEDVPALASTVAGLDKAGIELSVVPLAPSSDALALFAEFVDEDELEDFGQGTPEAERQSPGSTGVKTPVALLVLGLLAFVALAVHERFAGRLALPRSAPTGGGAR